MSPDDVKKIKDDFHGSELYLKYKKECKAKNSTSPISDVSTIPPDEIEDCIVKNELVKADQHINVMQDSNDELLIMKSKNIKGSMNLIVEDYDNAILNSNNEPNNSNEMNNNKSDIKIINNSDNEIINEMNNESNNETNNPDNEMNNKSNNELNNNKSDIKIINNSDNEIINEMNNNPDNEMNNDSNNELNNKSDINDSNNEMNNADNKIIEENSITISLNNEILLNEDYPINEDNPKKISFINEDDNSTTPPLNDGIENYTKSKYIRIKTPKILSRYNNRHLLYPVSKDDLFEDHCLSNEPLNTSFISSEVEDEFLVEPENIRFYEFEDLERSSSKDVYKSELENTFIIKVDDQIGLTTSKDMYKSENNSIKETNQLDLRSSKDIYKSKNNSIKEANQLDLKANKDIYKSEISNNFIVKESDKNNNSIIKESNQLGLTTSKDVYKSENNFIKENNLLDYSTEESFDFESENVSSSNDFIKKNLSINSKLTNNKNDINCCNIIDDIILPSGNYENKKLYWNSFVSIINYINQEIINNSKANKIPVEVKVTLNNSINKIIKNENINICINKNNRRSNKKEKPLIMSKEIEDNYFYFLKKACNLSKRDSTIYIKEQNRLLTDRSNKNKADMEISKKIFFFEKGEDYTTVYFVPQSSRSVDGNESMVSGPDPINPFLYKFKKLKCINDIYLPDYDRLSFEFYVYKYKDDLTSISRVLGMDIKDVILIYYLKYQNKNVLITDELLERYVNEYWSMTDRMIFEENYKKYENRFNKYMMGKSEMDLRTYYRFFVKSSVPADWCSKERTLFSTLFPIYKKDWDAMAAAIPTKNAHDLKNYYLSYYKKLNNLEKKKY